MHPDIGVHPDIGDPTGVPTGVKDGNDTPSVAACANIGGIEIAMGLIGAGPGHIAEWMSSTLMGATRTARAFGAGGQTWVRHNVDARCEGDVSSDTKPTFFGAWGAIRNGEFFGD